MNGRAVVMAVVVLILLSGAGPAVDAIEATQVGESQSESTAFQQDQIDADEVRMNVAIRADGTAEWTIEFWVRLDDDERAAAFESLREDIRDDPDNYTRTFAERMNETVATASDATGREMAADGFDVDTERQSLARDYGVVRYGFRWHGFAVAEADELRAGDAIEGIYLDDGTRLLFEWSEDYELASVAPEPDDQRDRAVIWRGGETDFVSGEPRVVLTAAGSGPGATTAAAALVVTGLGIFGLWWYRNRRLAGDQGETSAPSSDPDSGSETGVDFDETVDVAEREAEVGDEPEPEPDTPADDPSRPSASEPGTGAPDMDLLSNEEQVIHLLETHGGRMKQQTVVAELGWTDAKTSKVVTGLREEGTLESFRLGRENVLSLPEADDSGRTNTGGDDGTTQSGGDDNP